MQEYSDRERHESRPFVRRARLFPLLKHYICSVGFDWHPDRSRCFAITHKDLGFGELCQQIQLSFYWKAKYLLLSKTGYNAGHKTMISIPRIDLWEELRQFRIQPDKDLFNEITSEWPPWLQQKLKDVIRSRFGDENISAPSILEAMWKLEFWPLDRASQDALIDLGNVDVESQIEIEKGLAKFRRYSFYVLARGADHDFKCMSAISATEGAALVRGLAIAEELGYSFNIGSVSLVNWAFAAFRNQHPLVVWAELADWVVRHTTNPYIPFNFRRTRSQWEMFRKDSESPVTTWNRVNDSESLRLRAISESSERETIDAKRHIVERQENHQMRCAASAERSLLRSRICAQLSLLTPLERLKHIVADKEHDLTFFPSEFAELDSQTIAGIPSELRSLILERLKDRRSGSWHKLLLRLRSSHS